MASWQDLASYIRANYKVAEEQVNMMRLQFDTGGRSQVVYIWHHVLMDGAEDWALVESPFATGSRGNLHAILAEVGEMVCGGAALVGDHLTFRHAIPLANLDVNEFERPLGLVTMSADRLEQSFGQGDTY